MAIVRLALSTPTLNTDTLLFSVERQSLVSVIATNKSSSNAGNVRIWVQPQGSTTESQYAYITYDSPVPANNSLETFRFAVDSNDDIYIRSSTSDISFSLNGVYDTTNSQNIVTVSESQPNAPDIGDVWVNPSLEIVYFWDGSDWINSVGGMPISGGTFTGPVFAPTAEAGTNTTQIATTAFVSTALSSASGGAVISDTAPESPTSGKIWYNSLNGKTYIYYEDESSSQWVEVGTASLDPIGNYDGGVPSTIFGGVPSLDGGGAS
jgi:hypothetical protein